MRHVDAKKVLLLAFTSVCVSDRHQLPVQSIPIFTLCTVLESASCRLQGVSAMLSLQERSTMTQAEVAEFVSTLRRTFTDLEALPMPTIAVLEGYAGGGGAELALACDLRVADTRAVLTFPEARLGIMPGAGGTQRLARVVGLSAAKVGSCSCMYLAAMRRPADTMAKLLK